MSAKKNKNYSLDTLNLALDAIRHGMPIKAASREYKIPKTTLHSKFHGKYPIECSAGAPPILTKEEESTLVMWIISVAKVGFPVSRDQLLDSVRALLVKKKKSNPFKDNRPGRHWYEGFLRRHPEISKRMSQNLINSRATLTEVQIRNWFLEIEQYLQDNNFIEITNDPRRIYNADESAFFLCPKGKQVLALRGSKTVYNHTVNDEKECITTLITANAAGDLPPPMVMFAYERIPQSIVALMPDKWGLGKSESGWMTGESFFEYVTNIFHPWLVKNNVPLPVLFYVDGHKSHLTMHLSAFCSQNGIILISLFPNATHILQPMDVGVFHPLKNGWKNAVTKFRTENNKKKIRKENFAPLLHSTINEVVKPKMIQNAFRTCGLYPFDSNAIDYSKLISSDKNYGKPVEHQKTTVPSQSHETMDFHENHLKFVESFIEKNTLREFDTCLSRKEQWMGNIKDDNLFILWKKLKESVMQTTPTIQSGELGIENIDKLPDDSIVLEGDWIEEILNINSNETTHTTDAIEIFEVKEKNKEASYDLQPTLIENTSVLGMANSNKCNDSHDQIDATISNTENNTQRLENLVPEIVNSNKFNDLFDLSNTIINSIEKESTEMRRPNEIDQETEKNKQLEENQRTMTEPNMDAIILKEKKDNESPEATTTTGLPFNVPSPFKTILFWPEKKTLKKNNLVKVPSVASSEQWKAYYRNKQAVKDKKEEEKENRKRLREKKHFDKKTKKSKRNNATRKILTDDSEEDDHVSKPSEPPINNTNTSDRNFNLGDYVTVDYLDVQYPGVIEDLRMDEAFVSVMTQSGNGWKWPLKKDVLWYNFEEIKEKIKVPLPSNRRGVFCVPELKKFENA